MTLAFSAGVTWLAGLSLAATGCFSPPDIPPDPPGASSSAATSATPPEESLEPKSIYQEIDNTTVALRPKPSKAWCDASVCVHAPSSVTEPQTTAILNSASATLSALIALRLATAPIDGGSGGDGRLDIYVDSTSPAARPFVDAGSASVGFDRGTSFIVTPVLGVGCTPRQSLASAVAGALLLRQDAALEQNTLSMLSDYLATIVEPCSIRELEAIDVFQRSPERTFTGELGETGPASFLFPWFLEDRYGTQEPGKLAVALAAIASQRTPSGPLYDEPDMFDALRVTQHRNKLSLADTLLEFAVDRAFIGSRSDETHLIDVAKYGALGRVRMEWVVDATTLPRRFRPLRPIAPLGMTYFWLDFSKPNAPVEFTFAAEWEQPIVFRWAIVRVDENGAEIGRQELAPVLGNTVLQVDVRDIRGAKGILIVGINEGEERRDEPFDPGRPREPPHGYSVTFYP